MQITAVSPSGVHYCAKCLREHSNVNEQQGALIDEGWIKMALLAKSVESFVLSNQKNLGELSIF